MVQEHLSLFLLLPILAFVLARMTAYLVFQREQPVDEHMLSTGETKMFNRSVRQAFAYAMRPLANLFRRSGVSPNALTFLCLFVTAFGGFLIACGHISLGGAVAIIGAAFDYFDGNLARSTGVASNEGAFLDSTLDRVGEFALFGGAALYFRADLPMLVACLVAIGSSQVVSYTRAKAEAFGFQLRGGLMQRSERVVLFCAGAFFGPYIDRLTPATTPWPHSTFAAAIILLGVLSLYTATVRTKKGMAGLR